jgi:hypothetical protein
VRLIDRIGISLCFMGTVSILAPNGHHVLGTLIMAAGISALCWRPR